SDEINEKLNLFLSNLEVELDKAKEKKKEICKNQPLFSPPVKVKIKKNFNDYHSDLLKGLYTCPSCRITQKKWVEPYFSSYNVSHDNDDVYALINSNKCHVCNSKPLSVFKYQSDFKKYVYNIFEMRFFDSFFDFIETKKLNLHCTFYENVHNVLDLNEVGIKNDDKILSFFVSPMGKIMPIETHGNNVFTKQDYSDKSVLYWPSIINHDSSSNDVSISINYISSLTQENHRNLLEMLISFSRADQNGFIMSANRAIEELLLKICILSLTPSKDEFLGKPSTNEKETTNFLTSAATYSYQLKFLLKVICKAENLPYISKDLLRTIEKIRKDRNDIAHKGKIKRNLSNQELVDMASSVTCVYSLLTYILDSLSNKPT
ncbi:hypothetical protein C0W34_18295, partial [Photobacterium angustum]